MYIRMNWKEAAKKFNAHEDFIITCGNHSTPYGACYYARDYHIGDDNFLTVMEALSIYNDGSVNCYKQVPEGVEPQEGKLFCMKVWDKKEGHFATAWMRASDAEMAKLEADYRGYKVFQIEEREV